MLRESQVMLEKFIEEKKLMFTVIRFQVKEQGAKKIETFSLK